MKNLKTIILGLALLIILVSAFSKAPATSITGTVSPADAGVKVAAVSKTDTFSSPVANGMFVISNMKPGLYNLFVEAKAPYKNGGKTEVSVVDGQVTDVGEIKLAK